ncbi:MAG: ABC transporter ATP-binding protein [Clostridia bacterium]|nr:ABC transporter ATP-binding protein [Clostridia bacterium]
MLKIDHLTKRYGRFTALDGLNLEIADRQLHGFVGPNGAGKTTTMRILATLLSPTEGTAFVDGVNVVKNGAEARKRVGYMPDFFGVYDNLKCREYLDFYARCCRIGAKERAQMADRLLDLVQLSDKRDDYVESLSRGMKQRLCLARSLIHDPKLLILDEPASGMDPRARAEMKNILKTLREMGKTVLISSHILPELSEMCDSLTILDHGCLVFSGSVEALAEKMNGNAPLEVRLSETGGENALEAAVTCLKELPDVKEILQAEPFLLQIRLAEGSEPAEILRNLVVRGVPVCDFHRAPMNLEKVFMEVTQDDA